MESCCLMASVIIDDRDSREIVICGDDYDVFNRVIRIEIRDVSDASVASTFGRETERRREEEFELTADCY